MTARYTVRAQTKSRYCVWDNDREELAISAEHRACIDLRLDDAFEAADNLNKQANSKALSQLPSPTPEP
jgi:hypothetical protein